jgi:LPXTG-motif cell wall-anchored protein
VSNSNGAVEIVELPEGKYKLIETKTVHGQTLLAEPVTIQMPCTEKGAENTGADHNVYFDGINHYYHLYYTITNTAQFQLPYTGADNHMMLTSFLGLTLLLGLSHVIFQTWTKRRGRSLCPHRLHMMCGRFMYAALSIQSTINHQGG